MIKAIHLYTGADGHSHFTHGSMTTHHNIDVSSVHFEETPPHSSLDWHTAPTTQYVITLSGVLEFTMHSGEKFTLHPGEVLIAMDTTGTGHWWKLVDDQPWRRMYVTFAADEPFAFVPDA
jgi:quercetin dioxygenase-like cupin family protein